jgi:uncharacterized protein YprB with RNaseH-like and TPR domain
MSRQEDFIRWYDAQGRPNMVQAEESYRAQGNPCGRIPRAELRELVKVAKNNPLIIGASVPKILYFDIESTGLSADFGIMLMYAWKWEGEDEVNCRSLLDTPETMVLPPEKRDAILVKELLELFNEADIIVAHYGSKFDCPFIQTRALIHGYHVADVRWAKILDPCITARKQLKFQSNRMDNIAEALGFSERKSSVPKNIWYRSHTFDGLWFTDAITQMIDYCKQDVVVLYKVAKALAPMAKHLPNWKMLATAEDIEMKLCGGCGGALIYKGHTATKSNRYDNFQCEVCGKWQRGTKPVGSISHEHRTIY